MAYGAGVDVGSTQTKAVVIDERRAIVARALTDTGANVTRAAEAAFRLALKDGDLGEEEVEFVVGTGYGRYKVTFGNTQVTEISCHGRGAVHMFPATRTVIDMGGLDTKAIRISPAVEILDFCMNDKCAAGTGRFLQAAAHALELPLEPAPELLLRDLVGAGAQLVSLNPVRDTLEDFFVKKVSAQTSSRFERKAAS